MSKRTWLAVAGMLGLLAVSVGAKQTPPPGAGLWHLLPTDADEKVIPQHRLDIRLYPSPAPFRAAIVNRNTNQDMPYSVAEFDGKTLRLGYNADGRGTEGSRTWLQMTWDGVRFTGTYVDGQGNPVAGAVALKLIRAPQ